MKNTPNNYMSLCYSTRGRMRHIVTPLIAAGLVLCNLSSVHAREIEAIQPEDITRHQIETSIVPAKTIYIKVEDPIEAASLMSDSHVAQAKQGWRVFDVTAHQYNEDFRGVFITYVRRY